MSVENSSETAETVQVDLEGEDVVSCGYYHAGIGTFCENSAETTVTVTYSGLPLEVPVCADHEMGELSLIGESFPLALGIRIVREHQDAHTGFRSGVRLYGEVGSFDPLSGDARKNVRKAFKDRAGDLQSLPVGEKGYVVFDGPDNYRFEQLDVEAGQPVPEFHAEQALEILSGVPDDCSIEEELAEQIDVARDALDDLS